MKKYYSFLFFLSLVLSIVTSSSYALAISSNQVVSDDYFDDDYHEETFEEKPVKNDTFYAWNIFWHNTNDYLLVEIAKPMHNAYSKIVTNPMQNGLHNFRENLRMPRRFINAIFQAEFKQAFIEIGRFIINTTSSLGFADVASQHKPLYPYNPDNLSFGYTFAKWGVKEGPYFVIPFWGPSTIREAVGVGFDFFADPFGYVFPWYTTIGIDTLLVFNDINTIIKPYETLKSQAFDPYIAIKNAYLENLSFTRPKT